MSHRPYRPMARPAGGSALVVAPWLLLYASAPAGAAPGDLDLSFAGFGTQAIVRSTGQSEDMAVGPDGRIVTVGTSGTQLVIKRYQPNGSVDATFGSGGTATLLNPAFAMRAKAVAVQLDGKIVVAGWVDTGADDYLLARVQVTGALDGTFGAGGYRTIDFAGSTDHAVAVRVQSDGKILVAGTSRVGGDEDFSVARVSAGGALDLGFSGDGKLTIPFGGDDYCTDLAIQSDERIVLAGHGSDDSPEYDNDICLARLDSDGSLDASFDGDGKASAGFGSVFDRVEAVAVQADGKIVVSGYIQDDFSGKLARFHPWGLLDGTFDGDGVLSISGSESLGDVVIQPDGGIVVVGGVTISGDRRLSIYRRSPSGAADPTFGGEGAEFYDLSDTDQGMRLALLPDGRILAHGLSGASTVMVRVWPDGTPDEGGYQTFAFDETGIPPGTGFPPGSHEQADDVAIQADGKIVVAGTVTHPFSGESDFAIARFLPDGELDTAFGTYGRVSFSFHSHDVCTAVAIQPDGKIVAAGYTGSGDVNFLVARFHANGTLDDTFGFFGFNVIDFMGGPDYARAVAIAPDGKIVLAGTVYNGVHDLFGVARFDADGVADNSFDLDAKQLVGFESNVPHSVAAVIVQPDRKIVVGGMVNGDFALMRLTEAGALDEYFGCQSEFEPICTGMARIDLGGHDVLEDLVRDASGWLYAAGARGAGPSEFALARFHDNGRLYRPCPPFPCRGWQTVFLDRGFNDVAYALNVRADGQLVMAGGVDGAFAWAQFSPESTTPTASGWTNLVGDVEFATAVAFTGASRLVLAGRRAFNADESFALASYETVPSTALDVPSAVLPGGAAIEGLAPNPSPGGASVQFVLVAPAVVEVRVHDVSGRLVRAVDAGRFPPGRHRATWDGHRENGAPAGPGVFFVSLNVEGRSLGSRPLVVVR